MKRRGDEETVILKAIPEDETFSQQTGKKFQNRLQIL
jgi:hypothetical protein